MSSVNVLLSSYNGADFITSQLDSLIEQTYPHVSILVRDDGSQDRTKSVLQDYANNGMLDWIEGENFGVVRSFMTLLRDTNLADYYAFCDQDDIWIPNKIDRAVSRMNQVPASIPLLYFTQTELVDRNLNSFDVIFPQIYRPISFGHALVQNVVTGCTMVINDAARQLILSVEPDWNHVRMHDWWIYLVIAAHGQVIYDAFPTVKYRQHGNNQIGTDNLSLKRRWKRFRRHDAIITRQAQAFYHCYKETLPDNHLRLLEDFLAKEHSLLNRIKLVFNKKIYRQKPADDLILKVLLLLNRL